jgi:hypothetical protein
VFFPDQLDSTVYITVDMVVNGHIAVLARGVAPVHHIQVNALLEKGLDHAPVRLEIQHGFTIDQGVDHQQRRLELGVAFEAVMLQLDAVFFINNVIGCYSDFGRQRTQQYI